MGKELDPTDWGWVSVSGNLEPIKTDKPPAPENIMKIIRCSYKGGCKTATCSCRKVGFECSPACSTCKGTSCENSVQPDIDV